MSGPNLQLGILGAMFVFSWLMVKLVRYIKTKRVNPECNITQPRPANYQTDGMLYGMLANTASTRLMALPSILNSSIRMNECG